MDARKQLVFISYARGNQNAAQRLYSAFSSAGIEAWLDVAKLLPGQDWRRSVREAITGCSHFVTLLSRQSIGKRGFVQSELRQALDVLTEIPEGDIFLIPARLEECQIPYEELRSLHWVDLFPSFDKGVERIIRAIRATKEFANSETLQPSEVEAMIDVIDVRSVGGGASATIDPDLPFGEFGESFTGYRSQHSEAGRKDLPLAKMLKDPSPNQIASMYGNACAFSFHLVLKPPAVWATVRPPHVLLNDYVPLPKYKASYPVPMMHAHIYYVEIDDPARYTTNTFLSKCLVYTREEETGRGTSTHAALADLTSIRLIPYVPEFFVLRVNALTPGVYDFDIAVDASLPGISGPIPIRRQCKFLFDTK